MNSTSGRHAPTDHDGTTTYSRVKDNRARSRKTDINYPAYSRVQDDIYSVERQVPYELPYMFSE